MDFLENIKKIRGAETALGITFSSKPYANLYLPDGSTLIGRTGTILLCYMQGYQETVFAVDTDPRTEWRAYPIAYDFREFVRLVLTCGSAELTVAAGRLSRSEYEKRLRTEWQDRSHTGLKRLQKKLELTPVEDPRNYIHTVQQVIDYSKMNGLLLPH